MNIDIPGKLAAPFEAGEVKFKPAVVSGNRAMALAYVDARVIQDRLDNVLGVDGWQDDYTVLPEGSVVCRLSARFGDQWLTKQDVGSPSEQPDDGDKMKAAFSDALKRAAVKFGVGRYLYRMPAQWHDYDPKKKQFVTKPSLPAAGQPAKRKEPPKQAPKQEPEIPAVPDGDLLAATETALDAADLRWDDMLKLAHEKDPNGWSIPKGFEEPIKDEEIKALGEWVPRRILERIRTFALRKSAAAKKGEPEHAA